MLAYFSSCLIAGIENGVQGTSSYEAGRRVKGLRLFYLFVKPRKEKVTLDILILS